VFFASTLALIAVLVGSVVAEARSARTMWGTTMSIVVAEVDIEPGTPIRPDEFSMTDRPVAFVPDDALIEIPDVVERSVRRLAAGEVVTRRDLHSTRGGIDVPEGHRAIGLPLDPTVPDLEVGDLVDLFVIRDVFGTDESPHRIDRPSLVIDVTDEAVILAVEARSVAVLANAGNGGRVVVALR
jgi:Flp pilus assembly protein CpaB